MALEKLWAIGNKIRFTKFTKKWRIFQFSRILTKIIFIYFSQDSSNSVEWLNQNAQVNEDGTIGNWKYGEPYPLSIEQAAVIAYEEEYIYVFGELFCFKLKK